MGKLRKIWEKAKKTCPEFAKIETKRGLGRELDDIERLKKDIEDDLDALCKKLKLWNANSAEPLRTTYQYMRTAGTKNWRTSKGISKLVSELNDLEKGLKFYRKKIQDKTNHLINCL